MKRWHKVVVAGFATFSLCAAALFILLYGAMRLVWHDYPFMGQSFTPEKWAEAGNCDGLTDFQCVEKQSSCPRGPMVRSLIRQDLQPGTDLTKVLTLLGPPEGHLNPLGEGGLPGGDESCPTWSLGMCSGMKIDYDSLYVCFDSSARVVKAGHIQH